MSELTPETARDYLLARGLVSPDVQPSSRLSAGNLQRRPGGEPARRLLCAQAIAPQLRVKDDWPFDWARLFAEHDCMRLLCELLLPESVPDVRFSDDENFLFGMSRTPPGGVLWTQALLDGQTDLTTAKRAGDLLADLHNRTAADSRAQTRFARHSSFIRGRVDPYHWTAAKTQPV